MRIDITGEAGANNGPGFVRFVRCRICTARWKAKGPTSILFGPARDRPVVFHRAVDIRHRTNLTSLGPLLDSARPLYLYVACARHSSLLSGLCFMSGLLIHFPNHCKIKSPCLDFRTCILTNVPPPAQNSLKIAIFFLLEPFLISFFN